MEQNYEQLILPARKAMLAGTAVFCLFIASACRADGPGGFMEQDSSLAIRPLLTATQIAAFMPERGLFTFPAPYNTQGIRITNASDCSGQDCVDMTYSYWRNLSNSTNSNIMYIFVGLDRNRGGRGPTLFSYDKTADRLTEVGPLFAASSPYSWHSGEGWYFSYNMPTKLYMQDGSKLLRYDVLAHTFETVFDSTTQYPNTIIRQTNSSNDDDVHSATLQQAGTYATLGCIAYKSSTQQFFYFAAQGNFDECQIDKSGRYLLIKELLPTDPCTSCDEDNVIVDLQTGKQSMLLDQNGAAGHSDLGYGYIVGADNWASQPNAWLLWNMAVDPMAGLPLGLGGLLQGELLYYGASWNIFAPSHISFENARNDIPIYQQYACGGGVNVVNAPRADEIICFMLDGSRRLLVVAPVMTDMGATGGDVTCPSCTDYAKDPKGNIDPTGQYFFWTSNLGGDRLDAFVVKVPYQLLTGGSGTPAPVVTITSPASDATVTGSVTVSASVNDPESISSVTFELNGGVREVTLTRPPYSISWDTGDTYPGANVITAVAVDSAGHSGVSTPVTVIVAGRSPPGGIGSGNGSNGGGPPGGSSGYPGGGGAFDVGGLLILWILLRQKAGVMHRTRAS